MDLVFSYDIVCPYAYMASTRIVALAARTGAQVHWRPVLLGGIFRALGSPSVPAQHWPASKQALGRADIHRQAQRHGLSLSIPDAHPRRTVEAMRLLVGTPAALRPALTQALYQAYWENGEDVSDLGVLSAIARRHGVDPAVITSPEARQGLFDNTAAAVEAGAFGVPTMQLDTRSWWGADRLHFVEAALSDHRPDPPPAQLGAPSTLRFFHDFSSPFSYLASTQIEAIAHKHGARLEWVPILLGGLFRDIGTPNVPLFAMSARKRAWVARDLQEWADWWNVDFDFPTHFPVRTILPLRISIQETRAIAPLYRALWVENRNIGDPTVVEDVLRAAGLDAAKLIAGCASPGIKARLRENTQTAARVGACGVPTFHIEQPNTRSMLIWGQDRLSLVEEVLGGWRPDERGHVPLA